MQYKRCTQEAFFKARPYLKNAPCEPPNDPTVAAARLRSNAAEARHLDQAADAALESAGAAGDAMAKLVNQYAACSSQQEDIEQKISHLQLLAKAKVSISSLPASPLSAACLYVLCIRSSALDKSFTSSLLECLFGVGVCWSGIGMAGL